MLYESYVGSLLQSAIRANGEGLVDYWEVAFQGKESLIHRARNRAGTMTLEGNFDKLLTIDADIQWTYEDFKRIITSDKAIVGGIYPLKGFPVVANFNALPGRGDELFSTHRGFDLDAFQKFCEKYADPVTGLAEVRHVPTGFLCVTREVLAKLSHTVDVYFTFMSNNGDRRGQFHFYPSDVKDGTLRSEDWGFCDIAREAGFPVHIDTKVLLGHTGYHTFRMGQFFGEQKS
jgi:hypothetical protein